MLPSHAKPFSVAESMNACPADGSLTREAFSQFTCLGAWVVPGGYAIRRLHCKACSKSTASRRIDGWAMRRMLPSCAKPFSQFTCLGSTVAPGRCAVRKFTGNACWNFLFRDMLAAAGQCNSSPAHEAFFAIHAPWRATARQFSAMLPSRAKPFSVAESMNACPADGSLSCGAFPAILGARLCSADGCPAVHHKVALEIHDFAVYRRPGDAPDASLVRGDFSPVPHALEAPLLRQTCRQAIVLQSMLEIHAFALCLRPGNSPQWFPRARRLFHHSCVLACMRFIWRVASQAADAD